MQTEGEWHQKETENISYEGRATEIVNNGVNILYFSHHKFFKIYMMLKAKFIPLSDFSVYVVIIYYI